MEKALHVFISYSWDNEPHKEWVLKLANYLIEKGGCDVTLDQYDLSTGGNMTHFMEKGVADTDKVLLILTPNYKLKADGRQGGVGMEYSMISQGLYTMQSDNKKFLPILREGSLKTSAPTYVQTTIYHDMTNDLMFDKTAFDLLRAIHDKPKLVKPKRGAIPDFSQLKKTSSNPKVDDGFAKSASKILKAKQLKKDLEELQDSEQGVIKVLASATKIFQSITAKAKAYSQEMEIDIHVEQYNNHNSIRLQAGDYYVIIDYTGYTNQSVRLISLKLSSGKDEHYQPKNGSNLMHIISNVYSGKKDQEYFPQFNNDKNVVWECEGVQFTENQIIEKVFGLLLEAMSREEK